MNLQELNSDQSETSSESKPPSELGKSSNVEEWKNEIALNNLR